MGRLLRVAPLLILLAALIAAWWLGLGDALSWASLAARQHALRAWVATHAPLALLGFVAIYVAVTALSIPQASVLSVAAGALFGIATGSVVVVVGATLGAALVFLAARTALAEPIRARAGPLLARLRPELERDGFHYLLSLRLLPLFPFWLVNLAAALAGMRLLPFVLATAIGIIPGVLFFVSLGAGLGDVLAAGGEPTLSIALSPRVLLPRLGLASLALAPVLWRRWRKPHG